MSAQNLFPDSTNIPPHGVGPSDTSQPYRDLCSTCNHAEACGGRSGPKRPIFFCEEFDVFVPVSGSKPARAMPTQSPKRRNTSGRTGLCVNCDNAETCVSPKPDGGIWHCEEYQ